MFPLRDVYRFRPRVGELVWKASSLCIFLSTCWWFPSPCRGIGLERVNCNTSNPNSESFPSPCRGIGLESLETLPDYSKIMESFRPRVGELVWKDSAKPVGTPSQRFPSPCRGIGLERLIVLSNYQEEMKCFRPRVGELVWKEFTSGTLTQRGFEIPQSTHLRKVWKIFQKSVNFVGWKPCCTRHRRISTRL